MAAVAMSGPGTARLGITVVTAMGVLLAVVAGGIFDEIQPELLIAPVLCGATAIVVTGRHGIVRLVAAVLAILGSALLIVVLADGSYYDVRAAAFEGPRRLLTTEWPSPTEPTVVGAVGLLLAIVTSVAADLAGRSRWHLTPLAVLLAGLVALLALSAPVQPVAWAMVLLGVAALVLALARPGETPSERSRTLLGDPSLIASILLAAVVAIGASGAIAWADRADPRQTQEPEISATLLDPVEATVALREADPTIELFILTERTTPPHPSFPVRWRIAALDSYDGQRWVPRLALRPIGRRLGTTDAAVSGGLAPLAYDIEVLTDELGLLLPFPGRPLAVTADVETDIGRTVVKLTDQIEPGTVIGALSDVTPTLDAVQTAVLGNRQVDELASSFTELAEILAGDGTELERLRRIESTMRTEWQLDSSAPGSGQQLALIERFVDETRRGTKEQFVTAYVLLARSLGFDARVATGFIVPSDEMGTPLTLDSSHAAAWPEVAVTDVGWLALDPVPPVETTDEQEEPPPPEAQSPPAAQPPIAPPTEQDDPTDDERAEVDGESGRWAPVLRWASRVAMTAGLASLPILIVIAVILLVKWSRRRRRLTSPDPAVRVRGAWANTTDSLVDAGLLIGPAWTDDRIAESAVVIAPGAPHEMRHLAAMSTQMTFGATDDGWRLADDAVSTSDTVDASIRAQRTRWERIRWRLSLRSLRPSTRSPVAP